jgi:uncharacterized circularly permuted ATP-grasp superfamily protein
VPRIIPAPEWKQIQDGLVQRITALNLFLLDIYGDQKCLHDKVIPPELVLSRKEYKRELRGVAPPRKIFTHVVGTDIIRDGKGRYLVLEDNCRVPSGVSYVLENRTLLNRVFPEFFASYPVRPIKDYPSLLLDTLLHSAPRASQSPVTVVLSPGIHNSAYFEHSYLAREMGVDLVEGRDLLVEGNRVFMRRTHGKRQVDVIYRRVDDDFVDPLTFRRDSMLGVPGLLNVYREGNVVLANAPGAGVADDKSVYAFMPALIKYYLGEEPLLPQVPTYLGASRDDLRYITEHAHELVVKTTGDAGGYGMLMGPFARRRRSRPTWRRSRRIPATTSRSRWWISPRIPRTWTGASSRAASTCGPSSSTAIASASCPAGSPGWRCVPAPTSSTPPRAAAARTPGCWRPASHDPLPRRRRALLDGPLSRARREHRPPPPRGGGAGHRGVRARRGRGPLRMA